jgi:hypothetical protein
MNESKTGRRWILGGTGAALLVIVSYVISRSHQPPSPISAPAAGHEAGPEKAALNSIPDISCPDGYEARPDKAALILSSLRRTSGGPLLGGYDRPLQLCFGSPRPPSVTLEGVVLLDRATSAAENSARVAHLLVHLTEGAPFDETRIGEGKCSQLVGAAVRAEARALAMEVDVRESLEVTTPARAFGFEPDIYQVPRENRIENITEFLLDHPAGADNIIGYVNLYTRQCEERSRQHSATPRDP